MESHARPSDFDFVDFHRALLRARLKTHLSSLLFLSTSFDFDVGDGCDTKIKFQFSCVVVMCMCDDPKQVSDAFFREELGFRFLVDFSRSKERGGAFTVGIEFCVEKSIK